MLERGSGAIVNVASIVSVVGMAKMAAYAASKGAIARLTKFIAVEYGGQGVIRQIAGGARHALCNDLGKDDSFEL